MDTSYIIETNDLCFSYEGGQQAIHNINLKIPKGKTTAVLGGNGAGKSTLFLNINAVLKPNSGKIYYDNKLVKYDNKSINQMRRRVGMVFQDPNDQLFSASVQDDIAYGALNMGLEQNEIIRRIEHVSKQTGIFDLLEKPTHALSYGQKKRVAIAGVLIMQPAVLILDEPTAGLDPHAANEIIRLILSIQEQTGMTVIFSTHDMDIIPLYCDFAYIMNKGRIVSSGTPKELMNNPKLLRDCSLRLPRIAHLMEILNQKDSIKLDSLPATISEAREAIKGMLKPNDK